MNTAPINIDRLSTRIEAISRFTLPDVPWTRRAFTPLFLEARAWLKEEFARAGLVVTQDAALNLIGRREGTKAGAKPLIIGSHCDTVVGGGRFDGILGVLAGLEVAQTLHEQKVQLAHPFELIDFLSEEPSDYGISCVGSRAFSGVLKADMLASCNAEGETLAEAIRRCGGNPEVLTQPLRAPGSSAAYLELHIEQGPVLETRQIPIGVVTDIVGIRRVMITLEGRADHAGTTPMDLRHDALVGAAQVIEACYRLASEMNGNPHYVVATIGRIAVTPNAANAVPGKAELTLEVRSNDAAVLACFPETLVGRVTDTLPGLGVTLSYKALSNALPTPCSPVVMQAIESAADALGYAKLNMTSGAGHDAVYVAPTGPIGMIFIPCRGGRSHCPEEWSDPQAVLDGTRVLYQALLGLDKTLAG